MCEDPEHPTGPHPPDIETGLRYFQMMSRRSDNTLHWPTAALPWRSRVPHLGFGVPRYSIETPPGWIAPSGWKCRNPRLQTTDAVWSEPAPLSIGGFADCVPK